MAAPAKALAIPLLGRTWLLHAWKQRAETAAAAAQPATWAQRLQAAAAGVADRQWRKVEAAPEGTLNHRLFRLAQFVMSRVDPSESFLKVVAQADSLAVRYPASLPERLVRRRLRLLAARARPFHRSRIRVWSLALLPQLPLIPLPLPNVTIYYTIWRIASNYSAGKGADALAASMDLLSDQQRLALAQQLLQVQQQQGVQLRGWAQELAGSADRLRAELDAALASTQQQARRLPPPSFVADPQLEQVVQPAARLSELLPESAVQQLMALYQQNHLLEHYRAAARQCLGAAAAPKT